MGADGKEERGGRLETYGGRFRKRKHRAEEKRRCARSISTPSTNSPFRQRQKSKRKPLPRLNRWIGRGTDARFVPRRAEPFIAAPAKNLTINNPKTEIIHAKDVNGASRRGGAPLAKLDHILLGSDTNPAGTWDRKYASKKGGGTSAISLALGRRGVRSFAGSSTSGKKGDAHAFQYVCFLIGETTTGPQTSRAEAPDAVVRKQAGGLVFHQQLGGGHYSKKIQEKTHEEENIKKGEEKRRDCWRENPDQQKPCTVCGKPDDNPGCPHGGGRKLFVSLMKT